MKSRRERGQSLVEMTLVLGAFLGLSLSMISIGKTFVVHESFSARVYEAARWGAVHAYDPASICNIVLYGNAIPDPGATPFMGLADSQVVVDELACPGRQCRVTVAIPDKGIQCTQPSESDDHARDGVRSKP